MAPRGEGPCLCFDPVLSRQLGNQVDWNKVAKLRENTELRFGGWLFVFHKTDPKWDRPPATTFFISSYGMTVEVNEEKPLIDAVRDIMQHGTVVVRSRQNKLCGVVTARDVAPVFVELAEPFLLLSQIENHLRGFLERAELKKDEYKNLVIESDPDRKARTEGPDELTLGELIVALEQGAMWGKVGLNFDKATFTNRLHAVREIRNKVMHFSPDGLPPDDVTKLKDTRELLEKL